MPDFNTDLVDDVARQKVVLFLGAGVSSSAVTSVGGKIKGWDGFLRGICAQVPTGLADQVCSLLDRRDYLLACELLQGALADSWEKLVTDEFGQKAEPSKLHEALVNLDQRIVLTTNFDKLIEMSWESKLGNATHYPKVLSSINGNIFRILKDHSGRYLIKIHGTVDDASTLIFSRSEYISKAFGNASYSQFIEMILVNFTLLFVGFSMDDPAICSLMEMYALRFPKSRPHYICSPLGIDHNIVDIYRRLRKLIIIQYDPVNNHEKLPMMLDELARESRRRKKEIFAAAIT